MTTQFNISIHLHVQCGAHLAYEGLNDGTRHGNLVMPLIQHAPLSTPLPFVSLSLTRHHRHLHLHLLLTAELVRERVHHHE